jgi:predicted nucleic acid-binding protein
VPKVYLETSFFSECCTVRAGDIARGRRATSLNWWRRSANYFDLYVSNEVVRELSNTTFPEEVRGPALEMLTGLPALDLTDDVLGVAEILVRERIMPAPAVEGDALHLAAAVVHRIDYLMTWNQKHLANPNKRTHLMVVCARLGYLSPEIVTPDLMMLEDDES